MPNIETLMGIAQHYNASIDWLIGLKEDSDIQRNYRALGDVAKALIAIAKCFDEMVISKGEQVIKEVPIGKIEYEYSLKNKEINLLYFNDTHMNSFLADWSKMVSLLNNNTIDDEVFSLWAEKTIKNLQEEDFSKKRYFYEQLPY